ncbi:hypothetical protein [Fuchsiella alkaliacetigena]|uniref:hypothetical protein n=1 Tax=Fuchsiella alkaliacetigena TaxID=957042 RepID=UPI00200A8DE3|nr:hypothetical protein [Fuchsiella alkaliacetigena]MCK8825573.1 hypothetical protein [Fuchsiella alkaliacetigena]
MKLKKSLADLSTEELEKLLIEKKEAYADLEEEKEFTLSQTGLHLSSKVKKEYKEQLTELEAEIEKIENLLADKD